MGLNLSVEFLLLDVISMMHVIICNVLPNLREDSMVIDVGEPADWVKINVRQTVSFNIFCLIMWCVNITCGVLIV